MELNIEGIGGMCPVQGYGTLDGERFYFRYRHDCAQLYVGPADTSGTWEDWDAMPSMTDPRLYAEINDVMNEDDRGWLEEDEATDLLHRMIGMLKPPGEWEYGTGAQQLATVVEWLKENATVVVTPAEIPQDRQDEGEG